MHPDPRRILIIKPSAVGDVVHALPVLALLRRRYPQARIAWVVTPGCADLLVDHPLLDEVILFDRKALGRSWASVGGTLSLIRFFRSLRAQQFDLVIDLQGLFRSGWMAWQTHAPIRIGAASAREFAPAFYTHAVDTGTPEQHAVERYLTLAQAAGCQRGPVEFVFNTTDTDRRAVADLLTPLAQRPFALLVPGTNWPTKRWPVEHYAQTAHRLRVEHGLSVVTVGASAETGLCAGVGADLDLCGRTTLRQLVPLIERAAVVVCNDSGPMHIAAALHRPMVALFGPTNPVRTGPYRRSVCVVRADIACSPCYSRRCSHQTCLKLIRPGDVMARVAQATATAATPTASIPATPASTPPTSTPASSTPPTSTSATSTPATSTPAADGREPIAAADVLQ